MAPSRCARPCSAGVAGLQGLISVEGAGAVVEEGGSQSQSMLQEFIAYVKVWPCVPPPPCLRE